MQFDPKRPIYLQIMEAIKRPVIRGELKPGAALKSIREMAREMQVNPNTMTRAFAELEREGFIHTQRGTGSFITGDQQRIEQERSQMVTAVAEQFLQQISELGLSRAQTIKLLNEMKKQDLYVVESIPLSKRDTGT